MADEDIRVNWRAVIDLGNGMRPVQGRLRKLAKNVLTVGVERNLLRGHRCKLALMLPKLSPKQNDQFIEGSGVVVTSLLSAEFSSEQFLITLEWERLSMNDEERLNERIRAHQAVWKR